MLKFEALRPGDRVTIHRAKIVEEGRAGEGAKAQFLGALIEGDGVAYHFRAEVPLKFDKLSIPKGQRFYFCSPGLADQCVAKPITEGTPAKTESKTPAAPANGRRQTSIVEHAAPLAKLILGKAFGGNGEPKPLADSTPNGSVAMRKDISEAMKPQGSGSAKAESKHLDLDLERSLDAMRLGMQRASILPDNDAKS